MNASARRNRLLLLTVVLILTLAGLIYAFLPSRTDTQIEPPTVDLSTIDPAVKEVIEKELESVRSSPESGGAWGRLGLALHTHIFATEAMTCFGRAEVLEPWNPRWSYFQGLISLADDPPAALPKLRKTVELCGDDADGPRLRLAETAQRSGLDAEAGIQFDLLLQHTPAHPRAHLGLARMQLQQGNLAASKQHLKFATEHPSTRKAARLLTAELLQHEEDSQGARQERATAAELPDDTEWPDQYVNETAPFQVGESARMKRASALIDRQRTGEAYQSLQQLVSDYPKSAGAWQLLGWLQFNPNQLAEAESSLRTSLANDPQRARTWFFLGLVLHRKGDRVKAIEAWGKAVECKPSYLEAYFNMGLCWKDENKADEAIAAFENALRCQPLSAPAHAQLGAMLMDKGQNERAMDHLRQAVELNPNDSASRKLLESKTGKR